MATSGGTSTQCSRRGGHGQEKDLQFFAACLIYLPQLPKLVGLVHILGQPAHPEVVNQRPILGYIGHSPHGYCALTGLTKPWPVMQSHAAGLSSAQSCGSNGCTGCKVSWQGQIMVLPALYTWPVIQWQHGPSKQGSFMPPKVCCRLRAQQVTWSAMPMA